ncbi:MAG: phosphate-starvation-inducible PsiE family protein [Synechococcales bacterium]|nr:phosphate-starvation-inducible PsiE family protein [Synechococcales bacterium]
MFRLKNLRLNIQQRFKDEAFLELLGSFENLVSKVLSMAMVGVILIAVYDVGRVLLIKVSTSDRDPLGRALIDVFGLFLNVLIALEILENITAYLKKHVIQAELVVITALIAVARKMIILDFDKTKGLELIGLAIAVIALSISYWIVRRLNNKVE